MKEWFALPPSLRWRLRAGGVRVALERWLCRRLGNRVEEKRVDTLADRVKNGRMGLLDVRGAIRRHSLYRRLGGLAPCFLGPITH